MARPGLELHEEPKQCVLWTQPELIEGSKLAVLQFLKNLKEEESPIGNVDRNLLRCHECGQLYLQELYYLRSEWSHKTFIPVETEEIAEGLAQRSVYDLLLVFPRLQQDRLTDGRRILRWATCGADLQDEIP